ncbi:hypothetical protein CDAR_102511 [Caerostris darwini]|uniref:Uncharacterized protein n=1 Tax=Caerostris darwini TaxID=1538125 RepID=A0AAV4T1R1_9ARAC|nr:hypothetical protein CDAR_102511 [Caerostris darwini]
MNNISSFLLIAVFLLIEFTSAKFTPQDVLLSSTDEDLMAPEDSLMVQSLKDMGVEVCEDKLHLCPATAECCKKDDGQWDCCPKVDVIPIKGQCCRKYDFKKVCCSRLMPKCRWWGCWFK